MIAAARDYALPLPSTEVAPKIDVLIHDRHVSRVMQHALIGRIERENVHPKIDIRSQFDRLWEVILRLQWRGRDYQDEIQK